MDFQALNKELGNADILLIDQILKGRFQPQMRILDAGCGEGRNMVYFINNHFQIYGLDQNSEMVSMARLIARSVNKNYTVENIITGTIEHNPFPDEFFDVVLCINVLHAARNTDHFFEMVESLLKVLRKGGFLYIGMACESPSIWEGPVSKSGENIRPNDPAQYLMNEELMKRMLELKIIEKDEPARFHQIEGSICLTGIRFKKK